MTFHQPILPSQKTEYRVTLTLSVKDATQLWLAAAKKGLMAPGSSLDEVIEVIGPREDPSIPDCLAMLAAPEGMAGCMPTEFRVDELGARFPRTLSADNDERTLTAVGYN